MSRHATYLSTSTNCHRIVLLDTDHESRVQRLAVRGQPDLATDDMSKWAALLAENTRMIDGTILDASGTPAQIVGALAKLAMELLATT